MTDAEKIAREMMDLADHFGATLEQPDDARAWDHLLIYCPKEALERRIAKLSSAPPQAAPVTDNDIYYLKSIQRQLEVVKESLADTASFTLSGMAFADTVDWLDCFIDARERSLALSRPQQRGDD